MVFKHRTLLNAVAVAAFLTGLANVGLFCFTWDVRTAVVGSLCILFGVGYLMLLRVHAN